VTQEVFVRIYLSLPQYRNQGFKTWISRIAVNKSIDLKRSRMRKPEELSEATEELFLEHAAANEVEDVFLRKERQDRLRQKVNELPPNYRNVVVAYYIEEKSYQEIAHKEGIEIKSVESRLYRAKKWLREHWKEGDLE